jgi:hypothetical protein
VLVVEPSLEKNKGFGNYPFRPFGYYKIHCWPIPSSLGPQKKTFLQDHVTIALTTWCNKGMDLAARVINEPFAL